MPINYKKRKFTNNITENIENKINNTNCSQNEKVLNKNKINHNFKQSNNLIKSATNKNNKTYMKPLLENSSKKRDTASLSPKSSINSNNNTISETYDIQNFKLITITNDNNCLFRAMSYAIYKIDIYHNLMKYEILKYVMNNWENEKDIIKHIYNISNKNDYHNYIFKTTSKHIPYGTGYEALIFSDVYKKPIKILHKRTEFETYQTLFETNISRTDDNEETVYFIFNSDDICDKTGHFDLLLLKNTFDITQLSNQLHNTQLLNPTIYKYTTDEISNHNNDDKYILPSSKRTNDNCINELSNY